MKLLTKILTSSCLLMGLILSAIPGFGQTWAPWGPARPQQAVVGSTPQRQAAYNSLTDDQRRTINDQVRPYMQRAIVQALVQSQPNVNNQDLKVHAPDIDGLMRHDLSRTLSLQNSLTFINGSNVFSSVAQYPGTAAAFGANAASGQITGADLDHDGLPDNFENQTADSFTPFYRVSSGELDNFATFFDSVPETVNQRLGPNPFSYFRVKPLGFAVSTSGVEYGFLQVNYLTLWDHDSGLQVSGTCNALAGLAGGVIGIDLINLMGVLTSHNLDDEHSAALIAAPTVNGGFNLDPTQYFGIDYFLAAHEGTFFDHSVFLNPGTIIPANVHLELSLSRGKHSSYSFNPDGLPMFPDWLINAYYAELVDLLAAGIISQTTFDYLAFVGDTVFFGCVIEHFSDQGGSFASGRVNVGEPVSGSTLNGAGFILDPNHALPKLTEILWIVAQPPIIVAVSPAAAGVDSGGTQQFQATVLNNANQGVTWSISPQLGSITQAGLYTAPTITGQQTVTVTACSTSNSSRCGTALVFLNPLAGACLSPGSLTFGNQSTGTTSAAQMITLTSCGAADLLINSITTSGNFTQSNNCPVSLAVNASCTVNVTFTPATTGTLTGTLSVSDSAHNSPHTAGLSGTGVVPPPPPDFSLSIDSDQTIDMSVTQYGTIHYSVTFLNGLTGTVSLSLNEYCMGTVVSPSPNSFTSSGSGTITLGPFAAGATTGTMCFYLTGTHAGVSKTVLTNVTLTDGS